MKLIFERSRPGRGTAYLPEAENDAASYGLPEREERLLLPEVPESELTRHYTALGAETRGVSFSVVTPLTKI